MGRLLVPITHCAGCFSAAISRKGFVEAYVIRDFQELLAH